MAKKKSESGGSMILKNRRAYHEYEIIEELECGIVLTGTEVKSLRAGSVNFADSYAMVDQNELWLLGLNIAEYKQGNIYNHAPTRRRKLLAHKPEIRKLQVKSEAQGMTLVPLRMFWSRGRAKVAVGLVRGKATHDKRQSIKKREFDRDRQRMLRRS